MICGEIICLINQKMTVVLKITLPKNGFAFIAVTKPPMQAHTAQLRARDSETIS